MRRFPRLPTRSALRSANKPAQLDRKIIVPRYSSLAAVAVGRRYARAGTVRLQIRLYGAREAHVERVVNEGVSDRGFLQPLHGFHIGRNILQIEIMARVDA